jgi:hypothetical protein
MSHFFFFWSKFVALIYSFSTSVLDGGGGGVVSVTRSSPGETTPVTHCTRGWVVPRAGLDTEARGEIISPLPAIEPWSPGHPARSQTLYWLSYPAPPLEACQYYSQQRQPCSPEFYTERCTVFPYCTRTDIIPVWNLLWHPRLHLPAFQLFLASV